MAYTSLKNILGYVTLTKAVQKVKSGIPRVLPEGFYKVTDKAIGDKARFYRFYGNRQTARKVTYGNPARKVGLKDLEEVDCKLLHTFEEITLDPLTFKQLRSTESYELDVGLQEVKRQIREFTMRDENLRTATIMSALRLGNIYFDGDGDLLPTSAGAEYTHSVQLPANNQNQLNGIIADSWATPTTNIPLHLRNLKRRAAKDTGYELKFAFYGQNVPSYFEQNSHVIDYLARNPRMNDQYLSSAHGEIPDGLFGLTWVPVYTAFYEDADGVNQDLWDGDAVVFTPEVSEDWYGLIDGSFEVPKSIDIMSGEAAYQNIETVHGPFSYGITTHNPPTVNIYAGDTFFPAIKNPLAYYSADVAF